MSLRMARSGRVRGSVANLAARRKNHWHRAVSNARMSSGAAPLGCRASVVTAIVPVAPAPV